jgi:hypothetical protein
MMLEELDRSLVLLGRCACLEGSQVSSLPGPRIPLPGIESILTRRQLANHVRDLSRSLSSCAVINAVAGGRSTIAMLTIKESVRRNRKGRAVACLLQATRSKRLDAFFAPLPKTSEGVMTDQSRDQSNPTSADEYMRGGKGRKDEVGGSGIYPASSPNAPGDAELRSEGELAAHKGPRPKSTSEQKPIKSDQSSGSE